MLCGYSGSSNDNKTRKKAENFKLEIWFADDQDVHMRQQLSKVGLKMLMSSVNHEVVCVEGRELFVTII